MLGLEAMTILIEQMQRCIYQMFNFFLNQNMLLLVLKITVSVPFE